MRKIFLIVAALAVSFFTGSALATFDYAMKPAEEGTQSVVGSISGFDYSGSIDYPEDFDTDHQAVVNIAVSTEGGGLNDTTSVSGFSFAIKFPSYGKRNEFGYVGSMDITISFGEQVGNNISFVMSLPQNDPDETIYLYTAKITNAELQAMNNGITKENYRGLNVSDGVQDGTVDTLAPVFRVKLEKNADGLYEQTECKRGYSPVTLYMNTNYKNIKAFALTKAGVVWIEGRPRVKSYSTREQIPCKRTS